MADCSCALCDLRTGTCHQPNQPVADNAPAQLRLSVQCAVPRCQPLASYSGGRPAVTRPLWPRRSCLRPCPTRPPRVNWWRARQPFGLCPLPRGCKLTHAQQCGVHPTPAASGSAGRCRPTRSLRVCVGCGRPTPAHPASVFTRRSTAGTCGAGTLVSYGGRRHARSMAGAAHRSLVPRAAAACVGCTRTRG